MNIEDICNRENRSCNCECRCCNCECEWNKVQTHDHEFEGSVQIALTSEGDPHNHRFAGITGEVIPISATQHVHRVETRTDFYEDHFHLICDRTGPAIPVGDRHVHFLAAQTSENDGHRHEFRFATLINDPIGEES